MKKTIKPIDLEVDNVISKLSNMDPSSAEYTTAVQNLKTLMEARSKKPARLIEPEVVATVGGSFASVIAILFHERLNVITTKAIGFVIKPK